MLLNQTHLETLDQQLEIQNARKGERFVHWFLSSKLIQTDREHSRLG
jgi:hypothetical protein